MNETGVLKAGRVRASELGARLFRNNVGSLPDYTGRPVQFGLCKGSSDGIGWRPLLIEPAMVGQVVAQFLAAESKAPDARDEAGWRRMAATGNPRSKEVIHIKEQLAFIDTVRRSGGIAGFFRNNEEIESLLRG